MEVVLLWQLVMLLRRNYQLLLQFCLTRTDEYNRAELIREYNAGRYQDKGLPGIMKIGMPGGESGERGELKVSDITSYLRKLRQGVER